MYTYKSSTLHLLSYVLQMGRYFSFGIQLEPRCTEASKNTNYLGRADEQNLLNLKNSSIFILEEDFFFTSSKWVFLAIPQQNYDDI